jgi:hypothetical protein
MRTRDETPTVGEMLSELLDLVTGFGVIVLPMIILAVPALILLLPLAVLALPLVVLAIPLAILAAPVLAIRSLRRHRLSAPPAH